LTGLSATDAWFKAESVMGHIQHLSLESLVKMDHFKRSHQKWTTGAQNGTRWANNHTTSERDGISALAKDYWRVADAMDPPPPAESEVFK
jgi:hypothetical protein